MTATPQGADARELRNRTLCVECGPDAAVDEDGCCIFCGAHAVGEWADKAVAALERLEALENAARAVVRSVSIGGNGKVNVPMRYLTGLEDALLATPAPAGQQGGSDEQR